MRRRVYAYTCETHTFNLVATEKAASQFTPDHIGHYLLAHLAG